MMTIVSFCVILAHVVLLVNGVTSGPTSSYVSVLGSSLPGPLAQTSVQFVRNLSLNQCAAECSLQYHTSKFPCYAFQYASATRLCFLTNVTTLALKGGYLALKHNPNMRYFERPKGSYTNLFQPFPGQVLRQQSSYFAVFHNKSLENCARFCLIESRDTCMSFSYSATKRVCGLSKVFFAEGNGQKLAASGAYTHYQYFTTWPCNATIPWNYAPRAIASPYFPYASVTDVNCFLIIEAPEGKQVDLTFSTLFTQQNICQSHNGGGLVVKDGQTSNGTELSRLCSSDDFVNRRFVSTSGYLYLSFSTGSSPLAFKGVYEFKTVDPCADSPCQNHGTCIPTSGRYACACAAGYTGSRCETDVDDCASSPCYFGGRCVDLVGDYRCDCQNLFGGKRCDKFVGLCYLDPCQNGGTCFHRGVDSYVCNCPTGHTGQNCSSVLQDPCSNHSCQNGATCIPDYNTQTRQCACAAGFTGNECETNMDDCASSPCLHNIPCTDLVNDFKCECPKFMSGKTCENFIGHCYESDCLHGKCRPTGRDNITCDCDVGYTGSRCEVLFIDFCDPNPCKHGACSSFVDGPVCQCDLGYEGMFCEDVVDYCRGVNCSHGECATKEGHFTCNCIAGYQGRYCNESINHCLTADCHGGYCINTVSSHFCVCSNGRTGLDCDVGATTSMTSTTMRSPFLNVVTSTSPANPPYHDYCNVSSCLHGACDADFPTVCVCDAGFSGPQCDVFAGCARSNPCLHGNCTDVGNSGFMCNCEHGYSGQQCDVLLKDRDCSSRPCQNGGFCLDLVPGYQCVCVPGHRGDHCQWTDACARGPCITGTCVSRDNGFRCRVDPLVGTSNSTTAPSLPGWAPGTY